MDKKYLEDRLRELGIYSDYYHRMELKPLAALLPYDEKVNCILTGYFEGNRRMIAVTDSRIVVVSAAVIKERLSEAGSSTKSSFCPVWR